MSGAERLVPASLLEAEKVRYERRSQKVLGILARKDERIASLESQLANRDNAGTDAGAELRRREATLRAKVKDQAEQIEVLVAEVATLRHGTALASEKQRDERRRESVQQREVAALTVDLDGLRAKVAELEREKADQAQATREIEARAAQQAAQATKLQGLLKTAKDTCEALEAKLRSNAAELEAAQRTARASEERLARARETIRRAAEPTETGEHPSEQKARQLELQVRKLSSALKEARDRAEQLEADYSRALKDKRRWEAEDERKQGAAKQSALETVVVQQSEELVRLRSQLVICGSRERKAATDADFERRSLLVKVRTLEQQLRRCGESGSMQRKQLESTVRVLSGRSDLHGKFGEQAEQLGALRTAKLEAESKLARSEEELRAAREQATKLRRAAAQQEKQLTAFRLSSVYADLPAVSHNVVLQRLAHDLEECRARKEELEAQLSSEARDPQPPSRLSPQETEPDDDPEGTEGQEKRESARLRFRVRGLEIKLSAKEGELERALAHSDELQKQLDGMSSKLEADALAAEKQHSEQLAVLNRRIISHVREKQVFLDEKESLGSALALANAKLEDAHERLAQHKAEARQESQAMRDQIERLQQECERLAAAHKLAEACAAKDQSRLAYLDEAVLMLQSEHGPNDASFERLVADLTAKLSLADKSLGDLQSRVTTLETRLGTAQRDLAETRARERKAEKRASEAERERAADAAALGEMQQQLALKERQLQDQQQAHLNHELQLIDVKVAREKAVSERDMLVEQLAEAKRLFGEDLKREREAAQAAVRDFEQGQGRLTSPMQAALDARREQLEDVVRELKQAHKSALMQADPSEAPAQDFDPTMQAFERLANTVLECEEARLAQEAESRVAEWHARLVEGRLEARAREAACDRLEALRREAEVQQTRCLADVEVAIRQMHFENRLKLQSRRTEAAENLLARSTAHCRALARRVRDLEWRAGGEESGASALSGTGPGSGAAPNAPEAGDLLTELRALRERNIALETELADAVLRHDQLRACSDGEDEKRKTMIDSEKRAADRFKTEVSVLSEQLQSSKRELVNLAFEYESRLMLAGQNGELGGSGGGGGGISRGILDLGTLNELQRRTLEQSKEISNLHAVVTGLQSDLAASLERESSLQAAVEAAQTREEAAAGVLRQRGEDATGDPPDALRERLESLAQQTSAVLLEQKDSQIARLRAEADILSQRLGEATEINKSLSAANAQVVAALQKFERYFDKEKDQRGDAWPQLDDRDAGAAPGPSTDSICSRLGAYLSMLRGPHLEAAVGQFRDLLNSHSEQAEFSGLKEELARRQVELETCKSQRHEADERSARELARLKSELDRTEDQLARLGSECEEARARAEQLSTELATATSAQQDIASTLARRERELEAVEDDKARLEEAKAELEGRLAELEDKLEQARTAEHEANVELRVQQAELEDLRHGQAAVAESLEAEAGRPALEREMREQAAQVQQLRKKEARQASKIKACEARLEATRASLERVRAQLESVKKDWVEPAAVDRLRQELSKAKLDLRKARSQTKRKAALLAAASEKSTGEQAAEEALRKRVARLEERCRSQEHELASKEPLLAAARRTSDDLRARESELRSALEAAQKKSEHMARERTAAKTKIKMLQEQVSFLQLQGEQQQQLQLQQQKEQQNQQLQQLAKPLRAAAAEGAARRTNTENSDPNATKLAGQVDRLRKKLAHVEAQQQAASARAAKLEQEKASIEAKLEQTRGDAAGLKGKLKATEKDKRAAEEKAQELGRLAEAGQAAAAAAEKALCDALCRIADESVELSKKLFEKRAEGREIPSADGVAQLLELSSEDMRDIFGAEARFSDPAFKAQQSSLYATVARHKSLVVHFFSTRGGLPSGLSAGELDKLVRATCSLWQSQH